MKSSMNLRNDVKEGKLTKEKALEKLEKIPGGREAAEQTQTYRRLKRIQ